MRTTIPDSRSGTSREHTRGRVKTWNRTLPMPVIHTETEV